MSRFYGREVYQFVMLTSDSFCGNRAFEMNVQFCCLVTCSAVILWFVRNNPQCTTISFCHCWFSPLYPFVDVVFPWFVYADIISETVALDTPNNVAVFVTDAPTKNINDLSSFNIGQVSSFPILSHGLSLSTITTNSLTQTLQSVNKQNKNIQCCQLKFFQCSEDKIYSSVSWRFHYSVHSLYFRTILCTALYHLWLMII
jgi:hypothetical protein